MANELAVTGIGFYIENEGFSEVSYVSAAISHDKNKIESFFHFSSIFLDLIVCHKLSAPSVLNVVVYINF